MHVRRFLALVTVLFMVFGTTACNVNQDNDNDEAPDTGITSLTWPISGIPSGFNPLLITDSAAALVESFIFQSLVIYDEKGQVVPLLAQDWEVSADGREWTFYLREDVTWHDGEPFTAYDVEFTFNTWWFDPDLPVHWDGVETLAGIVVYDEHTVGFELTGEYSYPQSIRNFRLPILPRHIYDPEVATGENRVAIADMFDHPANQQPIGTGPYVFHPVDQQPGFELRRNENYWGAPRPYIDIMRFKVVADTEAAMAALVAGELDVFPNIPHGQINDILDELPGHFNLYEHTYSMYYYIGFQFDQEPFQSHFGFNPLADLDVRAALAHALDRREIVEQVAGGWGVLIDSPIMPECWTFTEDACRYEYSPETANDLLEAAGWIWQQGDDFRTWQQNPDIVFALDLYLEQGNSRDEAIAALVKQHLEEVGVKINIIALPIESLLNDHLATGNYQLIIWRNVVSRDLDAFTPFAKENMGNSGNYQNAQVTQILAQLAGTVGDVEYRDLYQQLSLLVSGNLPYLFLYAPTSVSAVHQRVQDVQWGLGGLLRPETWSVPGE